MPVATSFLATPSRPDSKAIIISYEGKFHRIEVATGETHDIPFTANVDLDVGPDLTASYRIDQGPVRATIIHDPQISPNGGNVVMSVLTKLYVMDTKPGATPKRLTSGDAREFKPVWSPDGRWIAFVTWSMDEGGHIWKVRARGRPGRKAYQDPGFLYRYCIFARMANVSSPCKVTNPWANRLKTNSWFG